jgi:hypothetical protein
MFSEAVEQAGPLITVWLQVRVLPGPPSSPSEPGNFKSGSDRPFVPGFPLSVPPIFGLCGHPSSLAVILAGRSPHPKIPFLADHAWWKTCGLCRVGTRPRGEATAVFGGFALLLWVQPKCFELLAPLRRRIAQPLDIDAARQVALDSGANQLGSKEGERDEQRRRARHSLHPRHGAGWLCGKS